MNGFRTTVGRRLTLLFVLAVLISTLPVPAAWAAPADLDTAFDSDGRVLTDINPGHDSAEAVVVQPDDKIVVGGFTTDPATFRYDSVLARYDQHGNLDPTFGTSGKVVIDFSGAGHSDQILDIALAPNGDIVAVGVTDHGLSTQRMVVARFGPTGTLDAGFGSGGIADTAAMPQAIGRAVAFQSDGKIVVGTEINDALVAARFTSAGQLDSSFDADGWTTADFGSYADDQAEDVTVDASGNIVVVGHFYGNATGSDDMAVARFDTDGLLDPSFDGDGKKALDFSTYADGAIWDYSHDHANGVALQADGKIVLAGDVDAADPTSELDAGRDFAAVRLSTSGALDTTFSGDGLARVAFSTSSADQDAAYDVAIQPNNKILLSGRAAVAAEDFGLARVMSDGSPDETFGTGGKVATDFEGDDAANEVALQEDGKIIAVGSGHTNHGSVALARYLGDPTWKLSVSRDGTGSGRVSSSPAGIDCGSDCTHAYETGTTVVLTAAPATGSVFSGWGGACSGTTDTCSVTMDAAKSVTATFDVVPDPVLAVTSSGPGKVTSNPEGIDCGLDCSESYVSDTEVTLTATPSTDGTFSGWSGACSGSSDSCVVSMGDDRSVTATFVSVRPLLSVDVSGSGTVTSTPAGIACGTDCTEEFSSGTSVVLDAAPAAGWTFSGWSGDCSVSSLSCTVSMDGAKSVVAMFVSASPPSGGGTSSTPEEDAAQQRAAGASCSEIADYLVSRHDLDAAELAAALNSVACTPTDIAAALQRHFGTSASSASSILAGLGHSASAVADALKAVYGLDCSDLAGALRSGFELSLQEMAVVLAGAGCDIVSVARSLAANYGLTTAENAAVLFGARLGSPFEVASALVVVYPATSSEEMTQILASHEVHPIAVGRVLYKLFGEPAHGAAQLIHRHVTTDAAVLAKILRNQYDRTLTQVGGILRDLGYGATQVVRALESLPHTAAADIVNALVRGHLFAADDLARALKTVFSFGAERVASLLHDAGVTANAIAKSLKKAFGSTAARIAKIFKALKMAPAKVAMALKRVFALTKAKVAALLDKVGYSLSQIAKGFVSAFQSGWNALVDIFLALGVSIQRIFEILKRIFG